MNRDVTFFSLFWLLPFVLLAQGVIPTPATTESSRLTLARESLYSTAADAFRSVSTLKARDPQAALKVLAELETAIAQSSDKSPEISDLITNITASIRSCRDEIGIFWPTIGELEKKLSKKADPATVRDYLRKVSRETERLSRRNPRATSSEVFTDLSAAMELLDSATRILTQAQRNAIDVESLSTITEAQRSVMRQRQIVDADNARVSQVGKEYPYAPPTLKELIGQSMAVEPTPDKRLAKNLRDCQLGEQQILLMAAPADGRICQQVMTIFRLPEDGVRKIGLSTEDLLAAHKSSVDYVLFAVDTTAGRPLEVTRPFLEKLKLPIPPNDGATFAILDLQGHVVDSTTADQLQTDFKVDGVSLVSFLRDHTHKFPDAEQLLADALADANRTGKRVLFLQGGPLCMPCLLLSRYLQEHSAVLTPDYVFVKIDSRFANAPAVLKRVRGYSGGVPWMAILDSQGKPLVTSDGPFGNIGFPSRDAELTHFEAMLRTTSRKLTDANIRNLIDALVQRRPESVGLADGVTP